MKDDDINKVKEAANFTFKNPTANIKTNILEGETTSDRKNVKFTIYYSKDSKVQNIQAEGTFLKNSSTVSFVTNPPINLKEGKTIIPNQICEGENGEYLYIINKVGAIKQEADNDDNIKSDNDNNKSDESDNILPIDQNNKSNLNKISIILISTALITLLALYFVLKK